MAALCLLPAHAIQLTPPKPATPLEQAKSIAVDTTKAMDGIISVIEKVTDEKSAKEASDSILAATEKIQEFTNSSKELQSKLRGNDKKEFEKTMEEINMAQYNERFNKALKALADKPTLLEILKPAQAAFSLATTNMADENKDRGAPIRLIDKGGRVRIPR